MDTIEAAYRQTVDQWRTRHISSRAQLADALSDYRVRFAYNSGNIENPELTYHDTRDVFEDGRVHGFSGNPRTLFEIQNLRDCHELMLDAFAVRRPVDEPFLLEVHRTLTQGTYDERRWRQGERPGAYKVCDYVVGAGDVVAQPAKVPDEVQALLKEVGGAPSENALTVAAYFHAVLENIHPFADGNGRVGRELMNYLLLVRNHPPIIVFEADRVAYYSAMEAWDAERDLGPLQTFLKVELVRTWTRMR
jgi:Fic family protein